jgi:hypothetical protein
MRKSEFAEAQIVQILAEYDAGASMEEIDAAPEIRVS